MNKESIVLFGLGKDFIRYRDKILNSYEVEFVTDNYLTKNEIDDSLLASKYATFSEIKDIKAKKIFIATSKYYMEIRGQLLRNGISKDQIYSILDYFRHDEIENWKAQGCPIPPPHAYKSTMVKNMRNAICVTA